MKFDAVILAGGKSTRMGRDKARLEVGGQTLLARQIERAREAGAGQVYISGPADRNYADFGCTVLSDRFEGGGPLAGIEQALAVGSSPVLLALAVDLPDMSAEWLRRLAAECPDDLGVIPKRNVFVEPLAAFYPTSARQLAEAQLGAGNNSAAHFARRCVASGLARFRELASGDEKYFANWNAPADWPVRGDCFSEHDP